MKKTHTPAPWTWHPTGLVPEDMASVSVIRSHNRTPYVSHADAALICAAPELLDRLKLASRYLDSGDYPENSVQRSLWEVIQETIAKAEGKS